MSSLPGDSIYYHVRGTAFDKDTKRFQDIQDIKTKEDLVEIGGRVVHTLQVPNLANYLHSAITDNYEIDTSLLTAGSGPFQVIFYVTSDRELPVSEAYLRDVQNSSNKNDFDLLLYNLSMGIGGGRVIIDLNKPDKAKINPGDSIKLLVRSGDISYPGKIIEVMTGIFASYNNSGVNTISSTFSKGTQLTTGRIAIEAVFGQLPIESMGDQPGSPIKIAQSWQDENLINIDKLDGYAGPPFKLHKLVADDFVKTFAAAISVSKYRPKSIRGWQPRKVFNNGAKISSHAWGIAVDFDYKHNDVGGVDTTGTPPYPPSWISKYPEFSQTFIDAGWAWGHYLKIIDDMHFQKAPGAVILPEAS